MTYFYFKVQQPHDLKNWEAYTDLKKQMEWWCHQQHFDNWGVDDGEECVFWFANEQDYMVFVLRWA